MEETTTFRSPLPFLIQVSTALLKLGLSVLHNGISSTPFERLLGGITDHTRRFCLIIWAVMESDWWVWLLTNTRASFPFLLLLPSSLLAKAGSSPPLPWPLSDFVPKSSQLLLHLWSFIRLAIMHFPAQPH